MSRSGPSCIPGIAIAAVLACVGAMLTLPAAAAPATAVTFQPNNPWTQQVGSVSARNDYADYSVQVDAGKTLQVNLITRDPNVFFKVRNETAGGQLVDTYKTGATTWSTEATAPSTYTIHVYVDPAAMQRGEVAKYALQIGRYGKEDMQAATTEVTFAEGNPWAQFTGALDHRGTAHDYTVDVAAGKSLQVNLLTRDPSVHFKVEGQAQGQPLVDSAKTGATTWTTSAATPTHFTIQVYAEPVALPRGATVHYTLQVGRYDSSTAPATPQAAPAGTSGS